MARSKEFLFGLSVASLYFMIVAGLATVARLDPEGKITESGGWALTLPTGLLAGTVSFLGVFGGTLCFAGINAVILCVVAWLLVVRAGFVKTAAVLALGVAPLALVAWWFNRTDLDLRVLTVNNIWSGERNGAWVATSNEGLRVWIGVTDQRLPALNEGSAPESVRKHLVFIPNGTKAVGKNGGGYLLRTGRIVDPYPSSGFERERDGVVEVVRIKITSGPQRGLEGWIPSMYLLLPPSL